MNMIFSEDWLCIFDNPDGSKGEVIYCTQGKNAFKKVENQFKKDYPKAKNLVIRYQ